MEKVTGRKAKLTFLPKRHGDQDIWISNISKIKHDLGWKPKIDPKKGIRLMMQK